MSRDRRDTVRFPILGSLHGDVMVYQPMDVTEIGPAGVTVDTTFPLHLDSLHELRVSLADRSLVVKARVVHSRIVDVVQDVVTYRSGLEFVDVPDHVVRAIHDYVTATKASRGV